MCVCVHKGKTSCVAVVVGAERCSGIGALHDTIRYDCGKAIECRVYASRVFILKRQIYIYIYIEDADAEYVQHVWAYVCI